MEVLEPEDMSARCPSPDIVLKGNGGRFVVDGMADKVVVIDGTDMHVIFGEIPKSLCILGRDNRIDGLHTINTK